MRRYRNTDPFIDRVFAVHKRRAIFGPPQPTSGERSIRELTAPGEFRFA